ncbi:MAG: FAD-dependent oxidoreductase [Cellulomonas sp.]|uniref:NAD(P)/FAD-dependent oxidoreductase n=1 Tax=Cellulomonas sp. TaxID=40001 RepID=UPI00181C7C7E|nr:FAD-binding oxidoreductase [Cellulomonas sp.]NMM29580.1 FAD-dependent oxidoreductase [Cellulomonas sp.]
MTEPRGISLWFDQLAADPPAAATGHDQLAPRPSLAGDTQGDVVVVGAGLTGLWTAYYLLEADPSLDVIVVEQEIAGLGASGRNDGWCSALFPTSPEGLARQHGRDAALAMRAAMRDTVVEVGGVAAAEEIECDFAYGGTVTLARTRPHLAHLSAEAHGSELWGDEMHLHDAAGVAQHVVAEGAIGGSWTPDCARIQPARLVRGLAEVVTARGARLVERTRALRLSPRAVITDQGTVRARTVVRATEAWTSQLHGSRRDVVPVYSLMIATEPLSASFWADTGLARGQTFTDGRHLIVYGQRTSDDRIAFGGRGAPYHWGSEIRPGFDHDTRVTEHLRAARVDLFPGAAGARITHAWGGPLAIPRDWHPSVGYDEDTQMAWAGGYVADGVAASNLAGRTIADLVTGSNSPLVRLPWVGHRSPSWEPEPLRWAGVTAGVRGAARADLEERLTGRPSRVARALTPMLGH